MAWHDNWGAMRGRNDHRSWMTRSDLVTALRKLGYQLSCFQVSYAVKAGRVDRPPQVYGHFRFTKHHLHQMRMYLDSLGERSGACHQTNVRRRFAKGAARTV